MQGAVLIHIKEAKNLPAADNNGLSDPYAVLKLGKESKRTVIQYDTLSPLWNEKFEFVKVGPLFSLQQTFRGMYEGCAEICQGRKESVCMAHERGLPSCFLTLQYPDNRGHLPPPSLHQRGV